MAEREPAYLLAERLAPDAAWQQHVRAIRDRRREVATVARYYGRHRADARALFAEWLEACAIESNEDAGTLYMAMANLSEIMVWDANGPLSDDRRRYWPDPRSHASWDLGAKVIAARGGPACARCSKLLRARRIISDRGRWRWQNYCASCRDDDQRRDKEAANALLAAVCGVVGRPSPS